MYKNDLSDERLQATLLIGICKFDANYKETIKDKLKF